MRAALVLLLASSTAHAHQTCDEVSSIVGREHCTEFGTWSAHDQIGLEAETDLIHERLGVAGSLVAARGTAPEANDGNAWGVRERLLGRFLGPSYVGLEFDLGAIDDGMTIDPMVAGRLVGGVHAMVIGDFMVSAELAGGARAYRGTSGVLEARGRLDWWATPHMTVGVSIGTSLLDSSDHTLTFGLGGHLRAFDGGY